MVTKAFHCKTLAGELSWLLPLTLAAGLVRLMKFDIWTKFRVHHQDWNLQFTSKNFANRLQKWFLFIVLVFFLQWNFSFSQLTRGRSELDRYSHSHSQNIYNEVLTIFIFLNIIEYTKCRCIWILLIHHLWNSFLFILVHQYLVWTCPFLIDHVCGACVPTDVDIQ